MTKEQRAEVKAKVKAAPYRKPAQTRFPQPRYRKLNAANAAAFFEYWHSIPEELQDLIEVRSYRCWPIVNLQLVEPERRDYAWEFIEGKCPFDPDNFESQIMSRTGYGSGEYRFDLKEKGGQDIVCSTYVKAIDLNLYPPVLDYKTLVQCDANKQFVRSLRRQNIPIPWDDPDDKENDDMAGSGELVTAALGAIKDLSQSAIQANKEAAEAKVEVLQAQLDQHDEDDDLDGQLEAGSPVLMAQDAGFKMMSHAATAAIDMMARHAGTQFSPIEMMKAAKDLMGGGAELGILVTAVREQGNQMLMMQKEQFEFMRVLMEKKQQPGGELDSLLANAEKLKTLREVMGWEPEEHEPPAAVVPSTPKVPEKPLGQVIGENIVPIMTMLTTLGGLAANIIYNMKATSPGQARNPAEDIMRAQQAVAAQMPPGMQHGMPPQVMQPGAPPPGAPPQQDLITLARAYVVKVSDAMKHHFFDPGFNGYTFAEYVRSDRTGAGDNAQGLQAYGTIKETLGREKFEQLIRESDIWPQLQGMPQKFKLFMDEFFGYEEWNSQQPAQETATAA